MVNLFLLSGLFEGVLADLFVLINDLMDLFLGHDALVDKLIRINIEDVHVFLDDVVHDGLGEHGLINFIVAILAIAYHIDNDILVECGAVFGSDPADVEDGLGVVGVDVEDGGVHHTPDIGTIRRGTRVARISGEPDLIVGYNVDCAPENTLENQLLTKVQTSHYPIFRLQNFLTPMVGKPKV